jgi:hypothetical protein
VTRLRETFDAAGTLESHGSLRQWKNGNLRVMLEPGIRGHRVRFMTLHAGIRARIVAGAVVAGFGITVTIVASFVSAEAGSAAFGTSGILGILSAFIAAAGGSAAKRWREARRGQFEALAAELERLTRDS